MIQIISSQSIYEPSRHSTMETPEQYETSFQC